MKISIYGTLIHSPCVLFIVVASWCNKLQQKSSFNNNNNSDSRKKYKLWWINKDRRAVKYQFKWNMIQGMLYSLWKKKKTEMSMHACDSIKQNKNVLKMPILQCKFFPLLSFFIFNLHLLVLRDLFNFHLKFVKKKLFSISA